MSQFPEVSLAANLSHQCAAVTYMCFPIDSCTTNQHVDADLVELKGAPINSFWCGIHPLDTMASVCEQAMQSYEV